MCSLCCRYSIFKEQLPLRSESRRQLFSLTHLATGCQTGPTPSTHVPRLGATRRSLWTVSRRQNDDCAMEQRAAQLGADSRDEAPRYSAPRRLPARPTLHRTDGFCHPPDAQRQEEKRRVQSVQPPVRRAWACSKRRRCRAGTPFACKEAGRPGVVPRRLECKRPVMKETPDEGYSA